MRILRVVHRLYPPKVGGLSFYAHLLSADQAKAGHTVVVLTTREGDYPDHEFRDGYEIFRSKALAWPLENPITLSVLGKLLSLADNQFDVLHAHSHLMFTTNLAAIKKRLSRNPFVITNHGFRVKRGRLLELAQDVYLSSVGRRTLRSADYVISLTETERRRTVWAGVSPAKTIVIPNGVDSEQFRPKVCEPIPNSIIWTGRYVTEKGLCHLLDAARIVKEEFPSVKFMLVGYGEEFPSLVELTRQLRLEESVTFLSPRSQSEIVDLLNRSTMFALPSLSEGFPSSVLEAMSCQKPVVASSGIGLEEVIGDAGLYAPPGNSRALAAAIKTLLWNEELSLKLGRRGRERVIEQYDWPRVVSAVNALFERALREKNS